MKNLIDKAEVLIEALPYIQRFDDKTFVIKYGGAAMVDKELKRSFCQDVTLLKFIGLNPVVVHGGGPQIGSVLRQMGKESVFIQGMRVTDEETMDIVEMVLAGKVNSEIVSLINRLGGKAVGLSGKDGSLLRARKLEIKGASHDRKKGGRIDLGRVGEVEAVDPTVLTALAKADFIPVIAPVGVDGSGATYNINADLVAGKVAVALGAEKLMLLTDVEGVKDRNGRLLSTLSAEEVRKLVKEGTISGGMIPKVECCITALREGVRSTHVVDGRVAHAVLLEIFTDVGIGTQIVRSVRVPESPRARRGA
ncbi:MAG: acetylglutamate kinase [Deltaproteobacteria bacterium RBG_13_65_10]|jgi:acetylglutamate kinase|nr:MAG: acetylglutamate kinase [Deltaproteobacteria bacterium RBG_13_65_10]